MKRSTEMILAVIGIVLSGLLSMIGFLVNSLATNSDFQDSMKDELAADPALAAEDLEGFFGMIESVGPTLIIVGIVSLILGLVGTWAIKGNKKPILAGIALILAAVVITVGTVGFGFLPGLLFLIAGIMCFVRKPKVVTPEV
ncbi:MULTISPECIES: DUF4064 domain-containing protein [Bacillus]|uniref:DUF4064 domain-containing protein n=1 Tax=Bacillus TaxID=1386 RepID=UPI001D0D79AB|nr:MULTISPECIES: DUF4064 domain-containing protein [Bacillus]